MHEFEVALGQYLIYRVYLNAIAPTCQVYLAVAETVFKQFFQPNGHPVCPVGVPSPVLVVNLETEEVRQWIN